MTKFCKTCQELVYSTFCLHCGKEPGALVDDTDGDTNNTIAVDEGNWGGERGMTVLSFDDLFDSEGVD
jgi:hypothetical protein